jgi:hypothetical protein
MVVSSHDHVVFQVISLRGQGRIEIFGGVENLMLILLDIHQGKTEWLAEWLSP